MSNLLSRYWVTQPSTLQPYHKLHGRRVLARIEHERGETDLGYVDAYFTEGTVLSQRIHVSALSAGWPEQSAPSEEVIYRQLKAEFGAPHGFPTFTQERVWRAIEIAIDLSRAKPMNHHEAY